MSDPRTPLGGDAPDMAAAELALGILDGDDHAAAIRRVLAEPGFSRQVERWRGHLAQLFDIWPAMVPSRDVFARVERSLDPPVAVLTPVAMPNRLWPGLAALSSIAAVGLLVFLVVRPLPPGSVPVAQQTAVPAAAVPVSGPVLVASIDPEAKGASVTAVYDPRAGALRLTQARLAEGDRSAQLWVIAGDGVPHSLGLLHPRGGTAFVVTSENRARLAAGAVLAVSLEPVGGSPTGLPTGPVVAKGALSQV